MRNVGPGRSNGVWDVCGGRAPGGDRAAVFSVPSRVALYVLMVSAGICAAAVEPKPAEKAAMDEYWRHAPRHGCLCCSAYIPAPKAAAVPANIGSLPVLEARVYEARARLACFCACDKCLWAADDQTVYRVDVARRAVAASYGVADGLGDVPVRQLVCDGKWVWIVGAGGLSRLDVAAGKIEGVHQPRFTLGRMGVGPAGAFLVTDKGAYRWNAAGGRFDSIGVYPGLSQVARAAERGFWQFEWSRHVPSLLRGVVVGRRAVYVLAGNTLSRFSDGAWAELARDAWRIERDEAALWAVTTGGLLHYDCLNGKVTRAGAGAKAPPGKPVDLAVVGGAGYLLAEPRYDPGAKRFVGGGISRFDPAAGTWSTSGDVDGAQVAFTTTAAVDGADLMVGVRVVGKTEHRSLHPGMANVREYVPQITGLGVAVRRAGGTWRFIRLKGIDGGPCWVMGQQKRFRRDRVRPQHISHLLACGDRLWAVLRNFPENFYGGYRPTVQCIARRAGKEWAPVVEPPRAASLGLGGDQPGILCLTATHRKPIVLGHGFPKVLGLLQAADTVWVVHEGGIHAYDPASDRFRAVLTEGFRAYWQVTAGACGPSAVWFGTDAGTITRYDRRERRFSLVGVVPGRAISEIRVGTGTVLVRTAKPKIKALLPAGLSDLAKLPAADVLRYDGRSWSPADGRDMPPKPAARYAFQSGDRKRPGTYLASSPAGSAQAKRLACLKGVFQPKVLCQDGPNALWLSVWCGVARLELPRPRTGGAPETGQ